MDQSLGIQFLLWKLSFLLFCPLKRNRTGSIHIQTTNAAHHSSCTVHLGRRTSCRQGDCQKPITRSMPYTSLPTTLFLPDFFLTGSCEFGNSLWLVTCLNPNRREPLLLTVSVSLSVEKFLFEIYSQIIF